MSMVYPLVSLAANSWLYCSNREISVGKKTKTEQKYREKEGER